jgi:hypothetical protein
MMPNTRFGGAGGGPQRYYSSRFGTVEIDFNSLNWAAAAEGMATAESPTCPGMAVSIFTRESTKTALEITVDYGTVY